MNGFDDVTKRAADYWNQRAGAGQPVPYWTQYPVIRSYVNECCTVSVAEVIHLQRFGSEVTGLASE